MQALDAQTGPLHHWHREDELARHHVWHLPQGGGGALSQSKLADLVGNAVHNACRAVVLLATYCRCVETERPTALEASEVQVAVVAASTD